MAGGESRTEAAVHGGGLDLLTLPGLGRFLGWPHVRSALQSISLVVAGLIVFDGLFGPQLAPKNLAGVLPWVHWRGLIVLALLLFGNLFCMACPFMFTRGLAKRWFPADRPWPSVLRAKWLAVALLLLFFWAYEAFDLWSSPWLTAWLVVAYFVAAFAVDALFRGAAFCKYICPVGQFHFVNAMNSPFEVRTRDSAVCASCTTKDCLSGGRGAREGVRGCELWLFQQRKSGNMDCTFCLDCVHACPYDNVGLLARTPSSELWQDPPRASVGRLRGRADLAALALVVVFAAFANAFGMVGPVYAFERWLAATLDTTSEPLVLVVMFFLLLVAAPAGLLSAAAWASRAMAGAGGSLLTVATRYAYTLVPVGFGMWLAHYTYHFLIGALTVVPVTQSLFADYGLPLFGAPAWGMGAIVPGAWLAPIEIVLLELGLLGSLTATYKVAVDAERDAAAARRAFVPWAVLAVALCGLGIWLLLQPMEMRGTFGVG